MAMLGGSPEEGIKEVSREAAIVFPRRSVMLEAMIVTWLGGEGRVSPLPSIRSYLSRE